MSYISSLADISSIYGAGSQLESSGISGKKHNLAIKLGLACLCFVASVPG